MKMWMAVCAATLLWVAQSGQASEGDIDWQEGVHYHAISPSPPQPNAGETVEVLEFFWYGCPHCYQFEPFVKKWLQGNPAGIAFAQVPVLFGGAADLHAQAYYALEVTGELDRVHTKLFRAMHEQKQKLRTRPELEAWLAQQGVDLDAFREAMDSFAVNAKLNRARALMRRYGVRSVPTVVVDGRFRSGSGFQGYDDIIEVTEYLADKSRSERAAAQAN